MNVNLEDDVRRIAERASQWLEVLESDPDEQERAAFTAWIAESPLHVREFLNIAAVDNLLGNIDPQRALAVSTARTVAGNVLPIAAVTARPRSRRVRRWQLAAGLAALAITAGAMLAWQQHRSWREYITATGEQSMLELPDRTAVNLNTHSRLQVRFSDHARDVNLLEGEALFTVHPDPARPFRVHASATVIQAIGTAFNVRQLASGEIIVAVVEGKVQISGATAAQELPKLTAGEAVRIAANGQLNTRQKVDAAAVTAWRERRLVFQHATLAEIADEFNRYNERPRIRVQDPGLRARRYTVVLPADDPQSLIDYLRQSSGTEFTYDGPNVTIRRAAPDSAPRQ